MPTHEASSDTIAMTVAELARKKRCWRTGTLVSAAMMLFVGIVGLTIELLLISGTARNVELMRTTGTLSLIIGFPMLLVMAHCWSKVITIDKTIRTATERSVME